MTDYKQLCAKVLAYYEGQGAYDFSHLGAIAKDNAAFDAWQELRAELKTALAEPEPEGPTDEELMKLLPEDLHKEFANWSRIYAEQAGIKPGVFRVVLNTLAVGFARAVLARWGTPNSAEVRRSLGGAPQPIPVSERLPGPEDCNADEEVWAWRRFDPEGDMDNGDHWCLAFHEWLEDEDCGFTHWLPAHALPLPTNTSRSI